MLGYTYLLGRLDTSCILKVNVPLMKCSYSERRLTLGLWQAIVLKVQQGSSSELEEPSCPLIVSRIDFKT